MLLMRAFILGCKSLLLHPMRSLLTVLGIFIGVASVIWLLAIGEGISVEAQRQIESLGADNIMIRSIKPPDEASAGMRDVKAYGITRAEMDMLQSIPTISLMIPIRELPMKFTYNGNPNITPIDGRLVGCTADYSVINRLEVDDPARSHFLTPMETETSANVCVIAANLAMRLFPSEDPIKKQLYLSEKKTVLRNRWCSKAPRSYRRYRRLIGRPRFFVGCLYPDHHHAQAIERRRKKKRGWHIQQADI